MSRKAKYIIILAAGFLAFHTVNLPGQQSEQPKEAQQEARSSSASEKTEASLEKGKTSKNKTEVSAEKTQVKTKKGQISRTIMVFGFIDRNKDGRNDLFQDANGDGINDVTQKPYPHRFKFVDKNKDNINDLFVDADGDGVNDLQVKFIDLDGDGINDNVVDVNCDYINDITGLRYTRKSLRGYKFGFIKEERQSLLRGFIDEDADGIPDYRGFRRGLMLHGRDRFIDRDGDGIDDRRQRLQRHKHRPGRMWK